MAFSSGNTGGPMAEINVTPLVDVMLVLLIIFMITTPLMQHKVVVELPAATLAARQADLATPPITLTVKDDGSIFFNDEPTTKDLLEAELAVQAQRVPQPQINLRGDKTTKYQVLKELVGIAQKEGMRKIGFVSVKER